MKVRNSALDGLRGVAILLVVFGHAFANVQPLDEHWRRWLVAYANPSAGVRLFFVLSGYLITHLLLGERARTGEISLRNFYLRRIARIFPAFYFYLLAVTIASVWLPLGINWQTFFAAATFTWNYHGFWVTPPAEGYWSIGHLWTLALEQQFYLLWPVALVFLGTRRVRWAAYALMVWCPLARVSTYYLFPEQRGMLGMMFHTSIDSIMAGCAAALIFSSGASTLALSSYRNVVCSATCVWLFALSPFVGETIRGFPVVLGFTLDATAAAALVACVHRAPPAALEALLGRGLLPRLGLISYSLYLWQQPFLAPEGDLASGRLVLALLKAVLLAMISYLVIEKPVLRLKIGVRPTPIPSLN